MNKLQSRVKKKLQEKSVIYFAIYASLAAFFTYSCMYAFRKPFTVAAFNGYSFLQIDLKIWLITAQVLGYTISKFLGIKIVSELKANQRAVTILILIAIAETGLLLFYLLPVPINILGMFINGLPLGIIWGIVFSYLEGRKLTEILGAALSASFIIASGLVKSIGRYLIDTLNVSEFAMPFVTGLIFSIPIALSVFFLHAIPPPNKEDELFRTRREPMDKIKRKEFIKTFLTGIILLVLAYIVLTFFRELRDNFAYELWNSLGFVGNTAIYTLAEIPVTIVTLVTLAFFVLIRSNIKALIAIHLIIAFGFLLILLSTLLFTGEIITGKMWMILIGIGLYMSYVPFNAFLFERLISTFKYKSNIGFIMYICDSFGYLGSMTVIILKNFFSPEFSWLSFFRFTGFWFSLIGWVLILLSIVYFRYKYKMYLTIN